MKIKALAPLPAYRLELQFSDGTRGVVDLSTKVGVGVFAAWKDPLVFAQVGVGAEGQAAWPGEIELCPDTLYQLVTGRLPEDIAARAERAHA